MKNSLAKNNAGIDGNSKIEPREEKKNTFQGLQGKGQAVRLGVDIGGDDEMKPASANISELEKVSTGSSCRRVNRVDACQPTPTCQCQCFRYTVFLA